MQKASTKLLVIAITTAAIIAATTTSLLNVQSAYGQNLHSAQKEHSWDSGLGGGRI
jgi:hypothetical protein